MKVLLSTSLLLLAASLLSVSLCAQQKDTASGEHIFSSNCAACHGSDGRGGERAPDIATRQSVISRTDADLEAVVNKGLPGVGMPPFGYLGDQKVSDVVAYLRVLQGKVAMEKTTGDPHAGRELFYGKAECSKCHMVNGEGGFIATDLSTYGAGVSPANLRHLIVEPDQNLQPTSMLVEVRTMNGQRISGLLRGEDNFNISLQSEDGRFHMYSKAKLAGIRYTSHSIMPTDYESKLSSKELEDLVSFLITTASTSQSPERSTKKERR
jgi:cytochrome c oxidase cbb3-type subunit 3